MGVFLEQISVNIFVPKNQWLKVSLDEIMLKHAIIHENISLREIYYGP